jgi:hypothetical protein
MCLETAARKKEPDIGKCSKYHLKNSTERGRCLSRDPDLTSTDTGNTRQVEKTHKSTNPRLY